MSEHDQPVSAYAMYKRKSAQPSVITTKKKRKYLSRDANTVKKNLKKSRKLKKLLQGKFVRVEGSSIIAHGAKESKESLQKVNANKQLLPSKNLVHSEMFSLNNCTDKLDNTSSKLKCTHFKRTKLHKKNKVQKHKKEICTISPCTRIGDSNDSDENPFLTSRSLLEWLIHPLIIEDFFQHNWEKTPVHIKRNKSTYYKCLMSTPLLDRLLRENHILFTKNIDVTSYSNGERETHNPFGRAMPSVVWDYYMNGCSIRMLNPQTYIPKLHALNATLQEYFGCFVGANFYLTPPNSQGFAPHYDDIEAFILQIEGKKRWRLYKPCSENEYLARFPSKNFSQSEIGEPILDTVVNEGDLLYFPRGTIHQGETVDDTHSLHVTLSVYQKNSWGDFLEKLLPDTLRSAIENNTRFREGLPLDYLTYTGYVHSNNVTDRKKFFQEKIKGLLNELIRYIDVDKAADSMARNHIHDFLPPVLSDTEQKCSVLIDGEKMTTNGVVENRVEIEPDTRIRLLRSHCIRLLEEEGTFKVYYSSENSKEYHEYEPQFLEVGEEFVPAIREIILRYPEFIRVEDLPIEREDYKIQIVKDLWEKCLIITEDPLCIIE